MQCKSAKKAKSRRPGKKTAGKQKFNQIVRKLVWKTAKKEQDKKGETVRAPGVTWKEREAPLAAGPVRGVTGGDGAVDSGAGVPRDVGSPPRQSACGPFIDCAEPTSQANRLAAPGHGAAAAGLLGTPTDAPQSSEV